MAYVYKGTQHDVEPEPELPKPRTLTFDPTRCGTYANYRQHQTYNVPICDDCRDAMSAYSKDLYWRHKRGEVTPAGFDPSACGTAAGYKRHMRHGVPPCPGCRGEHARAISEYRTRKAAA